MKNALFLTVLLASGMSLAQPGPMGPSNPRKAKMENLTPEQRADKMTAKMKKELNLTAEQEQQAKAANLEFAQQQDELRKNAEALKSERKALMESHHTKIQGILTPEQQAKAAALKKERQEKRSEKRLERRQSRRR